MLRPAGKAPDEMHKHDLALFVKPCHDVIKICAQNVHMHRRRQSGWCTFGNGTSHLPAFSFRFCLTVLLSTLARSTYSQ